MNKEQESSRVFNYKTLRLLVGLIALSLPILVSIISTDTLSSISASYHTNARDIFVGLMFVVGSFLCAYNGHGLAQSICSKTGSVAAICIAIFPTTKDTESSNPQAVVHYCAAIVLFVILTYFCFGPFRAQTKNKGGKKGLRSKIYFVCGSIMATCLLCTLLGKIILSEEFVRQIRLVYFGEFLSLTAFGVAWIVAGKWLPLIVDDDDLLFH